ncbi:YqaE/Pmp3 family membrane protein [Rosistilla oblonga]|uniref:YqaE/Pmp3 family membrane protein n=1 Tax=Rosistilla oblonga TaxID=2527990 RepID=UPI003A97D182
MRYLLAIIFPPAAVVSCGRPGLALLNVILTACFWVPGVIHAVLVINSQQNDSRHSELISEIRSQPSVGEPPWHKEARLADFVILLPAIPPDLEFGLRKDFGTPFGQGNISSRPTAGDWIKQGEPIAKWNIKHAPHLLAPVDCRILQPLGFSVFSMEQFTTHRTQDVALVAIRPIVGACFDREVFFSAIRAWADTIFDKNTLRLETGPNKKVIENAVHEWFEKPFKMVRADDFQSALEKPWSSLESLPTQLPFIGAMETAG